MGFHVLPSNLDILNRTNWAVSLSATHLFCPMGMLYSFNRPHNPAAFPTCHLILWFFPSDFWWLNMATWPLLFEGSILSIALNEPTSVTGLSDFQLWPKRRAATWCWCPLSSMWVGSSSFFAVRLLWRISPGPGSQVSVFFLWGYENLLVKFQRFYSFHTELPNEN